MAKVLYSPASPYSAKVRMAAHYAGIPLEAVLTDTGIEPDQLIDSNPLGKIPVVIADDGTAVYDSRVIMQYFNRLARNKVFPSNAAKRLEAERLEALADGLCDCLLAHVYERRFRPQEKVHQDWLDKQWKKVVRGLDALNAAPPRVGAKLHGGQIALAAMLGYLTLRFGSDWERGRPKLKRWFKRFRELHPELAALLSQ